MVRVPRLVGLKAFAECWPAKPRRLWFYLRMPDDDGSFWDPDPAVSYCNFLFRSWYNSEFLSLVELEPNPIFICLDKYCKSDPESSFEAEIVAPFYYEFPRSRFF